MSMSPVCAAACVKGRICSDGSIYLSDPDWQRPHGWKGSVPSARTASPARRRERGRRWDPASREVYQDRRVIPSPPAREVVYQMRAVHTFWRHSKPPRTVSRFTTRHVAPSQTRFRTRFGIPMRPCWTHSERHAVTLSRNVPCTVYDGTGLPAARAGTHSCPGGPDTRGQGARAGHERPLELQVAGPGQVPPLGRDPLAAPMWRALNPRAETGKFASPLRAPSGRCTAVQPRRTTRLW